MNWHLKLQCFCKCWGVLMITGRAMVSGAEHGLMQLQVMKLYCCVSTLTFPSVMQVGLYEQNVATYLLYIRPALMAHVYFDTSEYGINCWCARHLGSPDKELLCAALRALYKLLCCVAALLRERAGLIVCLTFCKCTRLWSSGMHVAAAWRVAVVAARAQSLPAVMPGMHSSS